MRKEGRKDMRTGQDDTSELAACNFSHQRAASFELVMRSLKHVTPDAAYWLTPDPHHSAHPQHTRTGLDPFSRSASPFDRPLPALRPRYFRDYVSRADRVNPLSPLSCNCMDASQMTGKSQPGGGEKDEKLRS